MLGKSFTPVHAVKPCKYILVTSQELWGKKVRKMTQQLWELFLPLNYMESQSQRGLHVCSRPAFVVGR